MLGKNLVNGELIFRQPRGNDGVIKHTMSCRTSMQNMDSIAAISGLNLGQVIHRETEMIWRTVVCGED